MEFRLLGGLAVVDGERVLDLSTPKQRAVLAVLLLERDHVVSVDRLIDLLWGEESDKALSSLQAYVSRLRSALEPARRPRDPASVLLSQPPGYRLAVTRDVVDLYRFEDAVQVGLEQLREQRPERALSTLLGALNMWTGPVLPELADEPFVIATAERAIGVRLSAVEAIGQARLAVGDHGGAATLLEQEASNHQTRELLQGLLALALYRGGRQTDALSIVDRCRRALRDSAGLDPGPDLRKLESDLLAQSPSLDWHPPQESVSTSSADPVSAAKPTSKSTSTDQSKRAEAKYSPINLVGRSHESEALASALGASATGQGTVATVIGEPGIGKTRLAEWIVESARERSIVCAWARCPESRSTPPYWALTQIGDQLREAGVVDIGIAPTTGDEAPIEGDGQARFGVYRTMRESMASVDQPLLLVIDDLQWADPDSLRVLEHLAVDLASMRVLLVATVRPLSDDSPTALVDCLAEFARVRSGVQLPLGGLHVADVESWLSGRADVVVPLAVAELVHDRTGGNPLFIKEVTELLAAEGRLENAAAAREARAIPTGVQFVVRRRVSRLPHATQQLLSVAAVVGQTFDLETLLAAAAQEFSFVLDALGPALDAGLIVERHAEFMFSHALVADAISSEVNAIRRAAIHAAAARSLASRAVPGFGTMAAAISHHALEGILAGTGDLAIETSTRAALLAAQRFAHEDAAAHWANVALANERSRPSDVGARVDALIEQASALLCVDMIGEARVAILTAIGAADSAGMTDRTVRAASLLNHSRVWANEVYGVVDDVAVAAVERALSLLGDRDPNARAVLLGALPLELVFADRQRHVAACDEAILVARGSGNPATLAQVLNNTMVPNRPDQFDVRQERATEVLSISASHSLPEHLRFAAHFHLAECRLEIADMDGARCELEMARRSLTSTAGAGMGQYFWLAATISLAIGHYDAARAFVQQAYEIHRRGRTNDADVLLQAYRFAVALDRGGFDDAGFSVRTTADPVKRGYRRPSIEATALASLESGRPDIAVSLVRRFGPDAPFPDDYTTLFCATAALHVRIELEDLDGAAAAVQVLSRYASRWAGAGTAPLSMGVVGLALARYHALCGKHDEARAQFREAVEIAERAGAVAWLARSLVFQGSFLTRTVDVAAGEAALARARELATLHGFPYVLRRIEALSG
jgi:DNA-binding SARP family transcriptional activator/tetratricopeptide (TPR) repeat protein